MSDSEDRTMNRGVLSMSDIWRQPKYRKEIVVGNLADRLWQSRDPAFLVRLGTYLAVLIVYQRTKRPSQGLLSTSDIWNRYQGTYFRASAASFLQDAVAEGPKVGYV